MSNWDETDDLRKVVRDFLSRIIGDPSLRDEAASQVDLALLKRFQGGFRPRRPVAYALRVAWRSASQVLKRDDRNRLDALPDGLPAPSPDPSTVTEMRDWWEHIWARLPAQDRAILHLRHERELSYVAIARILGISVGGVGRRLNKATRSLRQILAQSGWKLGLLPFLALLPVRSAKALTIPSITASTLLAGAMLMKILVIAAGVIVIGLLAVLRVSSWGDPTAGQGLDRQSEAAPETGAARAAESPSLSPIATQPYREPPRSPATHPAKPTSGWMLSGVLVGSPGRPPVSAAVNVTPIARDWRVKPPEGAAAGVSQEDARFDVDVTDLVTDAVGELQVDVNHPSYLPASMKVHVSQATLEGGSNRLSVRIELVGARGFRGRVVDASGEPVAGARVATLLESRDSSWPRSVDLATTDHDGLYRVRTGLDGAWRIAAASPGHVPASRLLDAATKGSELPDLVLADGVAIRGTVAISGEPVPRAVVEGLRTAGGTVTIGGRSFQFQEGRLCRGTVRATCDERGRFKIDGLLPGTLELAVIRIPGCALHMDIGANARVRVSVPAPDVALDLEGARIDVLVRHEGAPVAGLAFALSGEGEVGMRSDADGKAGVLVKPGGIYRIEVRDKAFEPVNREVVAPVVGETRVETVELESRRERPFLLVTFRTKAGTPLERAGFGFYEVDDQRSFPRFLRDVVAKNGRFLVSELRPGRWRVVCRPGVWAGSHEYLLDAETIIDVPEDGSVAIAVSTRLGGRLRITARNPEGQPVQARCRLMQGSTILPVTFRTQYGGGGSAMVRSGVYAGVSDVLRALPAGAYRVVFTEQRYREHVADVVIKAGKTTVLDVTLIPRDR